MMQNVDVISDQQAHIVPVSDEGDIQALIKPIRGVQVILDRDVARLYGVATGALNRQVKRNDERFPKDFMFRLSAEVWDNLKCQIGISSWGGDRQLPYAFTENGIAMLSSVLRSPTAIEANIRIIRKAERNDRWFSKRKTTREVRHLLVLYRRGIPRHRVRGCVACGGEKPKYGIMCA